MRRAPATQPPQTLLAGKLTAPLLQPGIVTRDRLLGMLDEHGTQRLCLVVAPAGWGKTTLLTEWARRTGDQKSPAWVTLDETDDEPHRFWTYVLTALEKAAPDLTGDALAALRVPSVDPLEVALPALLNDLSRSNARHTLILDDYHLLTDARIHEAVEYLLSYLPPSLRLVIAARFDPPLPLARMRARSELAEIRAADLRFDATEAAGLVSAVSQIEVGSGAVESLLDRTEGWAVGLKLAALTLRGSTDPAGRAAAGPRRPTHSRLPLGGGAGSTVGRLAGVPDPDRGPRSVVRIVVRRGARSHRVGGRPGSTRAGRPLPGPAGCSPRVVPIPPALSGRAAPGAQSNLTRGRS